MIRLPAPALVGQFGEDGRTARCGGWGALAGDEGSAYGLVRDAIRDGLRGLDGRGEESALLGEILARSAAHDGDLVATCTSNLSAATTTAAAPRTGAARDGYPNETG